MRFVKMQGLGNDYIYVNAMEEKVEHPEELAIKLSDRHFGIGADWLILVDSSSKADVRMDMYLSLIHIFPQIFDDKAFCQKMVK